MTSGTRQSAETPDEAPNPLLPMHEPVVQTDGGPWAFHDYACPVCQQRKAVLDLSAGMFQPCWTCRGEGWRVVQRRRWRDRKAPR